MFFENMSLFLYSKLRKCRLIKYMSTFQKRQFTKQIPEGDAFHET